MISPTDILAHITNGRTEAETARALSLSHTLAGTEDMIREMMQAAPPVTVEVGNTADLADLAEMRDMLDGADWPPTPIGLWEALKRADEADELDRDHAKALTETVIVRTERDALTAEVADLRAQVADLPEVRRVLAADLADLQTMRSMLDQKGYTPDPGGMRQLIGVRRELREERDALTAEVTALRAQVADLTPGPWVRLGDQTPDIGETVLMRTAEGGIPLIQAVFSTTVHDASADFLWRRLPAGLLALPATAKTVAP